jgi:hypothetical protein
VLCGRHIGTNVRSPLILPKPPTPAYPGRTDLPVG